MEIVGGFMVMMSILGFFLAVIWLIMPFVVFATKGKLDRTLEVLDGLDKRLAGIETQLAALRQMGDKPATGPAATDLPPEEEQQQSLL
ncbi:hypothetical protein [Geobacter sp. SVR]|uniref:hypothetical protein n=1 Tax=Geobacter sp. SVR TaxID=2495594 RepID=UPI00143EFF0F|nr:hypothetical protein [Geobacter sp. SVR]BCS55268.1 hypothetical protein GSVR_35760 [Geobacter sp. SVR]GCF86067.1 hypothetical protein GSbR_26670 [Geobacter sp. SVR]